MRIFPLLLLSCVILLSCKPKTETVKAPEMPANAGVAEYETEIMKIHDLAMPKMTELYQLETTLRNIRTDVVKNDTSSAKIPMELNDLITTVKTAGNGMMDWMEYYSTMRAKLEPNVMLEFMKQELVKINEINRNIDAAIIQAKSWLAAHPS